MQQTVCSRLSSSAAVSGRPAAFGRGVTARRTHQFISRLRSPAIVCVLDVTTDTFEAEVLKADVPVLVDFWATWCGPCKLVAPSMAWAEKEYGCGLKVVKVEADANQDLITRFKVYGLPCLILFSGGAEMEGSHREGAITKAGLVQYLDKHGVAKVKA